MSGLDFQHSENALWLVFLLIPFLIHWINKGARKKLFIATKEFFSDAPYSGFRNFLLIDYWLLALRLVLLAVIVFIVMKPLFSRFSNEAQGEPLTIETFDGATELSLMLEAGRAISNEPRLAPMNGQLKVSTPPDFWYALPLTLDYQTVVTTETCDSYLRLVFHADIQSEQSNLACVTDDETKAEFELHIIDSMQQLNQLTDLPSNTSQRLFLITSDTAGLDSRIYWQNELLTLTNAGPAKPWVWSAKENLSASQINFSIEMITTWLELPASNIRQLNHGPDPSIAQASNDSWPSVNMWSAESWLQTALLIMVLLERTIVLWRKQAIS